MTHQEIAALCGWVPPEKRTKDQNDIHDSIMACLPRFSIEGTTKAPPPEVKLWEAWNHPAVVAATGVPFTGFRQQSGACVGAGGGTAVFTLAAVEVAIKNDPELALVPFWPLPYGRSRFIGGMRGRGDGSFGSSFAQAMKDEGIVAANEAGLPSYTTDDQFFYGSEVEYGWSDGARISQDWLTKAKQHPVKTVAPIRNADEGVEALANGYPITFCGNWGGMMRPPVKEGVLLNEHVDTWNHQQSGLGYMHHPAFGLLFWIMNQWGKLTHGICPSGAPHGGYWITAGSFNYQCKSRECFAWSLFDGFPARTVDWRAVA